MEICRGYMRVRDQRWDEMSREKRAVRKLGSLGFCMFKVNGCCILSQGVTGDVSGVAPTDGRSKISQWRGWEGRNGEVNWAGLLN